MTGKDKRSYLYERVREATESERNMRNLTLWDRPEGAFKVFLGASYFSRALNVDISEYYRNPELYIETNLRTKLLEFEYFKDDAPITTNIDWHPGVVMEPSLFGVRALYANDKEPWEPHEYILQRTSDLAKLAQPDFFANDAMRYMHRMYDEMKELLTHEAPDFSVTFPPWRRGPFGVACCLRGMERLCLAFYDEPGFVHELMSLITNARIDWTAARAAYIGASALGDPFILGNDEVNCPTLSPTLYEEFILPYERQLLERLGPLEYFHSCGCLTPLIAQIKTLKPKMIQVSPWTDLDAVCDAFAETGTGIVTGTRTGAWTETGAEAGTGTVTGTRTGVLTETGAATGTILDIWANVTDDVMNATPSHTTAAMSDRARRCRAASVYYQFNSGNMQAVKRTVAEDNEKILQWADACRKTQKTQGDGSLVL